MSDMVRLLSFCILLGLGAPLWAVSAEPLAEDRARLEAFAVHDGLPVREIRFEGNRITREVVLREELTFTEGDAFDAREVVRSRQYLQNLGLFKWVDVTVAPQGDGVAVTYRVKEKWYLLPIPRLGVNSDIDVSYGGELRWDNVLGLNQRIRVISEETRKFTGERVRDRRVEYAIPKIPGTRFGVGIYASGGRSEIRREDRDEAGTLRGLYDEQTDHASLILTRWMKRIGPSHGWRGVVGVFASHVDHFVASGTPVLPDASRRVTFSLGGDFTTRDDHDLFRTGEQYGFNIGFGRENLGSDHNFYMLTAYWRQYHHLRDLRRSNLNWQFRFGYNHGDDNWFLLGGGKGMRGLEREVRGDLYALLNVNWLVPLAAGDRFRGVLFTDIGSAWRRRDVLPSRAEVTFGIGFRWKIRSLVRVNLRGDIGYDPATGEYKAYGGTDYVF